MADAGDTDAPRKSSTRKSRAPAVRSHVGRCEDADDPPRAVGRLRGGRDPLWKSVVAYGTVYTMAPDGGPKETRLWQKGMALLKRIVPDTALEPR